MVAILSRIFTGPNITPYTVFGLIIMILGAGVCVFAAKIKGRLSGAPQDEQSAIPLKLAGLGIVVIGLIITIYLKG